MEANRSPDRRRGAVPLTAGPLVVGLCALTLALSACGDLRTALGLDKRAPDEFAVVTQAPLVLPPDYRLRPPQPGAPRPTETTPRTDAEAAVFEGASAEDAGEESARTPGEAALLDHAGAADADPGIRQLLDREYATRAGEDEGFLDELLFWQEKAPPGEVVDPEGEARRLRENEALGAPVTAGETPTIQQPEKAPLEDLF